MPGLKEEEKSLGWRGGNGTKVISDELSPNPGTWIFMTLDGICSLLESSSEFSVP